LLKQIQREVRVAMSEVIQMIMIIAPILSELAMLAIAVYFLITFSRLIDALIRLTGSLEKVADKYVSKND
jgi:hypothetical protein